LEFKAGGFTKVPSQEYVFTIHLPIDVVWKFMNDRMMVSKLFPGCREVKLLNELDSLWTVSFSLGPFSRTMELKGHTTELIKNERIAWTVSHDLVVVSGTVEFRKISEHETEITYRIEGRVTGPVPILQDIIVGDRMRALGRTYIQNIKEHLENKAGKEN
jgi:carbon monoxide dehydrogenase subunit G